MNEKSIVPPKFDYPEIERNELAEIDSSNKIQKTMDNCSKDIQTIVNNMSYIEAQGGWESYWKKGKNIKTISQHLSKVTLIQQKTLDVVVLLMGAAANIKSNYDDVLESIEDLSKEHEGNIEVLDYLVKIKKMVKDLKKRDELLESLITYTNDLRNSIIEMENESNTKLKKFNETHSLEIQEIVQSIKFIKDKIASENKENKNRFNKLDSLIKINSDSSEKKIKNSRVIIYSLTFVSILNLILLLFILILK